MTWQWLLHLFLVTVWVLLTNNFDFSNLWVGYVFSGLLLIVVFRLQRQPIYLIRVWVCLRALGIFIGEIIKSNITVARMIVLNEPLRPGIVKVPLREDLTDVELTAITHMITLTPGTLSTHIPADRSAVYVHMMDMGNDEDVIMPGHHPYGAMYAGEGDLPGVPVDMAASVNLFERLVTEVTRR